MDGILFSKILQMSLIGCYCIMIVLGVRCFLQKIGRKYSYYLWLIVFINLCIPFSIFSSFSLIPRNIASVTFEDTKLSKDQLKENEPDDSKGASNIVVFDKNGLMSYGKNKTEVLSYEEAGIQSTGTSNTGFGFLKEISYLALLEKALPWLEIIWILGICFFAFYSIQKIVRLETWIRKAKGKDGGSKKKIVKVEGLESAFLWGCFHPTIYLPKDMEPEEQVYILAHEQYHCRRKDHLVKIFIYGVTVLHWFNPLIWIAYSLCCKDIEISCDESVLEHSDKNIRRAYAESLLKYAAKQNRYVINPLTFGEPSVKSRISNVLEYRKKSVVLSVFALVLTGVVAAGLLMRPKPEKTVPEMPEGFQVREEETAREQYFSIQGDESDFQAWNPDVLQDKEEEAFGFVSDPIPGQPCENPAEAGWNLENAIDMREKFEELLYTPEDDTKVYLLENTEHYTLYGKGDYLSMLLSCEGSYAEITYPYTSNYMIKPQLLEGDFDGDNRQELAIKYNLQHGTGLSIDTFFMADFHSDGKLYVHQFLEEDSIARLMEHLSYEKTEDGVQALVDGKPAGRFMENDPETAPWGTVDIGAQIHFYYAEDEIQISADIQFWEEDENAAIYWTNSNDVTATVSWKDTGEFVLNDFRSRNRELDEEIVRALYSEYGTEDIFVTDIRYDSSKMNEESLNVSATILPKGGDSYDYAELMMKWSEDNALYSGNWEVEEIWLEK